jgi:enoyl-CoA hydratase/carnithine racemase
MSGVGLQFEGHLAVVKLQRPERRNALSFDLMEELVACLEGIAQKPEVCVVILEAEGSVFSSGHDLQEMTGRGIDEYRRIFDVCTVLMTKIQSIPQPVIAQVQGVATAAGCQLVATCDLAVASAEATFATPGVKIGLFCTTPMETRKLAGQIASASSFTVALGKQAYYKQIDLDQAGAYEYAKEVMSQNATAEDAQEGIAAFLGKRTACWKGK